MSQENGETFIAFLLCNKGFFFYTFLISEFLWSLGQNVESAVYGHLGTTSLAAYTLTCPIQSLIIGALSGLSAASGVMIGKRLGKKPYDAAYRFCSVCPN